MKLIFLVYIDPGSHYSHLPELSIAGELLTARAHVKVNVLALQIMACLRQHHPYHKDAQIDSSRLS